jgi:DnaJ-class molecular chaperone
MALQMRGEGEMSESGIPGELVVRLQVKPDQKFERLKTETCSTTSTSGGISGI